MSTSLERHGTDCFEVEAFLHRNEVSKLFKVRQKETGRLYCMEVVPKSNDFQGPINSRVQETTDGLSKFWVNLKFTFQTNSKLYYILEYIGETSLASLCESYGPFTEDLVIFYISEIVIALEELHSNGMAYGELDLEKILLDKTGHVVLWRNFCGKKYWTRSECVCRLNWFRRGIPCQNSHGKISERENKIDFQLLGLIVLQLFSQDKVTSLFNDKTTRQEGLLRLGSKSNILPSTLSVFARDLVTRLLKGQFYNSQHLKSHPFFNGVNWKMVKARLTTPPIITKKILHPPRLRKTSSEAHIQRQTPVSYNRDNLSPSYQVRPSSTPLHYPNTARDAFVDESQGTLYPQYTPHEAPPRLRSTLSSPDLTSFGQDMSDSQWTRDQYSCSTGIPHCYPVHRYSYGQSSLVGSPRNRYNLSHSLSNLTNIDGYESYEPLASRLYAGRRRTSSLTDLTGGRFDGYSPPPLTTHHSFPPGNSDFTDTRNTRNEDYGYRRAHEERTHGFASPGNDYIDRQYLNNSRQTQNYPSNSSYKGPISSFYKHVEYSRGDLGGYSNEDFRFGGYRLRRNSSTSDLQSLDTVEDSPRETYIRMSNEDDRESVEGFSSLQRSRSCSDLLSSDNEESRDFQRTSGSSSGDRRQNYPLAQLPIPSFEEFKRRNSAVSEDSKEEMYTPSNVQNNKKEETDSEKKVSTKDKIRSTNFLASKYLRERRGSRDYFKSRSDPAGTTRERSIENVEESYYSRNDVIHNLMLKYGLYERGEKKREQNSSKEKDRKLEISSQATKESNPYSNSKKDAGMNFENNENGGVPEVESSVRRTRIGRRASDVHRRDAPKLTHKSYSSLSPLTVQFSTENDQAIDTNNNLRINSVEGKTKRENIYESSVKKQVRREELKYQLLVSEAQSRPEITIADVYRSNKQRKSLTPDSLEARSIVQIDDKDIEETQAKISKTLWAAAKEKLKLRKSPNSSPFLRRKERDEVANEHESKSEQTDDSNAKDSSSLDEVEKDMELNKQRLSREELNRLKFSRDFAKDDAIAKRKVSTDSSFQGGQLRKNGAHSSLLSITSSLYSTDIDLDDSGSWHSELDSKEFSRMGSRKRWESFHSNVSADSGSAHMYEFETDSIAAEMEEGSQELQEQQPLEVRKKSEVEVERTDSGIGGDIGVDHNYKRNWEDIVLKSSRHWSVVAASARHWQDLARRTKQSKDTTSKKMKNITPAITEDMVECTDCQKFYVPEEKSGQDVGKEPENTTHPSTCSKCVERRVERKEAIIELVQTEINYGNDLQILKEEFYSPLQSGGILQPDSLAEIFLNLQELVEVSTKFSRRLQNGLEVSVSKGDEEFSHVNVGSIFLESVDLFQSYEIYCSKQNSASALLESLQKKNELLKIFLNVTCRENPKCRKMDLNSFLLAPVQRIMKYPLLLSRIRKSTPRRNPDREKLMQAQKKIEDQLNRINALNSSVEPKQRRYRGSGHLGRSDSLDKLQMKKMASDILNWTMSELHLLMHGVFEVVIYEFSSSGGWNRRGSKRAADVFMLFCVRGLSEPKTIDSDEDNTMQEDLFFPCESEATDAALVMLRKKMNGKYTLFKEPLSLDTCIICKDPEHKDSFEIINMSRETYVFKANGSKESKKWLKHLRLQAKDLGMWKKRRNGLPNIMIKNI